MKLELRKDDATDDWWVITRALGLGEVREFGIERREYAGYVAHALTDSARICDADVEGYAEEMVAIAQAIQRRGVAQFKRCAVDAREDRVKFWSPRNSRKPGHVPFESAAVLAAQIMEQLA